jgi:hypothetical protein
MRCSSSAWAILPRLFEADAEKAAPLLDLVLTSREKDTASAVPMCGVPFHSLEGYVRRCLTAGLSVAIAEQTEDPRHAKGLVRREIVEIVTPGLVANAIGSRHWCELSGGGDLDAGYWLAYLFPTGDFAATESDRREVFEAELYRIAPRELVARDTEKDLPPGFALRRAPDADFDPRAVAARVGFLPHGLAGSETRAGARAAAALVATVAALQPAALAQLGELRRYRASEFLLLDRATRRHLELFENLQDGGREGTLLAALDETRSPMGRRRLFTWLGEPLLDPAAIRARQDRVAAWLEPDSVRERLRAARRRNLDRAQSRATFRPRPRELAQLRACLRGVARVAEAPLADPLRGIARSSGTCSSTTRAGRAASRRGLRARRRRHQLDEIGAPRGWRVVLRGARARERTRTESGAGSATTSSADRSRSRRPPGLVPPVSAQTTVGGALHDRQLSAGRASRFRREPPRRGARPRHLRARLRAWGCACAVPRRTWASSTSHNRSRRRAQTRQVRPSSTRRSRSKSRPADTRWSCAARLLPNDVRRRERALPV